MVTSGSLSSTTITSVASPQWPIKERTEVVPLLNNDVEYKVTHASSHLLRYTPTLEDSPFAVVVSLLHIVGSLPSW